MVLSQRMIYGINSFPILAIPCFLLVGNLMNAFGVTDRIFRFANSIVGHFYGGLGHANIVASLIFAGMSGSAVGDVASLGNIEIKAMRDKGYPIDFSAAVTGASSLIGPIIPPSIPMVFYGVLAGVSVTKLFIGGIVPGFIMALSLMVWVLYKSIKENYPKGIFSWNEVFESFRIAFFPLWIPVILIGGIWTGIFTPTEAASTAIVYVLIVGFLCREITIEKLIKVIKKTVRDTAVLLSILAVGSLYGWMIIRLRIPQKILAIFLSNVDSALLAIFILVGFFLLIGCFLSVVVSINLLVPIILPILNHYEIDLLHFGLIMVLTLMLGVLTPPFGNVLYALIRVANIPFERLVKALIPSMIPILITIILIILFPKLVLFLPSLIGQ
jgi:tripartite ATP-independent transporter DctM subunit